jgi:hypothetical protein
MFREDERMEEHHTADDQSHYEISLTAGQAFVAFVLLLLSLAAAFAFGLMIGRGQADERLVVRKETPIVTEASLAPKKSEGQIVELPVETDEFQDAETDTAAADTATTATPVITEEPATTTVAAVATTTEAAPVTEAPKVPHYAQLLSTSDQKTAEALAARLIDRGFTNAYVERGAATEKGPVYRVRLKFDSESEARAAEPKLREFSKEVWITTK